MFQKFSLILLIVIGLSFQAQALIVEESLEEKESNFSEFLKKYFLLKGAFISSQGSYDKNTSLVQYGLHYESQYWSMHLAGRLANYEYSLEGKCKREDGCDNSTLSFGEKAKYSFDESYSDLDEFYVLLDFKSSGTLTIGTQKVVWGQFSVFSPVDFTLPIDFSAGSLVPTKHSFRLPQETVHYSIYPSSKWRLSAYYFPKLAADPFFEQLAKEPINEVRQSGSSKNKYFTKVKESEEQLAFRSMVYGEKITWGFTYYRPFDSFGVKAYTCNAAATSCTPNPQFYKYNMYGFEMRWSYSKEWSFLLEAAYNEGIKKDLEVFNTTPELRNWASRNNGGRYFINSNRAMIGLGLQKLSPSWSVDLSLIALKDNLISGAAKKGKELSDEAAKAAGDEGFNDFFAFPVVHISHKSGSLRRGFALGAFGGATGIVGYFEKRLLNERLAFGASGGVVSSALGELLEDSLPKGVELPDFIFTSSLYLSYSLF